MVLVGASPFRAFFNPSRLSDLKNEEKRNSVEQCRHASLNIIDNIEWMSRFHGFKLNKKKATRRPVALKTFFYFSSAMKIGRENRSKFSVVNFLLEKMENVRDFLVHCAGFSDKIAFLSETFCSASIVSDTNTALESPPMTKSSSFLITRVASLVPKRSERNPLSRFYLTRPQPITSVQWKAATSH